MTMIYFVLILGITVFIHELGHFLFAKKAKIYCYEFSLGMGPKIFGFKRKNDETEYCVRLFPIGGYVKMAGEEVEEDRSIPATGRIQNKTFLQRFLTIVAGATFNFFLGIFMLFLIGLIYGSLETKPFVGKVDENYNAYKLGVREGDLVLSIDGSKVKSWDDVLIAFEMTKKGAPIDFEIKHVNGKINKITVVPIKEKIDNEDRYIYGISMTENKNYGFISAVKYSFEKFGFICRMMVKVIGSLFTGKLGISSLSGPVGIYRVVGQQAAAGFENILYLVALLSINIGFVNLIPFPAFDGGRVVFLIIEKIMGKPVDSKVENIIHTIGFGLLMLLMVIITIQDIKNIIG